MGTHVEAHLSVDLILSCFLAHVIERIALSLDAGRVSCSILKRSLAVGIKHNRLPRPSLLMHLIIDIVAFGGFPLIILWFDQGIDLRLRPAILTQNP